MKICYDTLVGVRLTRGGTFRKNGNDTYVMRCSCHRCGDAYLTLKCRPSNFCSFSCANISSKRSKESRLRMVNSHLGKKISSETKAKMSLTHKLRLRNEKHPNLGKEFNDFTKAKMSEVKKGKLNSFWRGGVKALDLPLYNTYAEQISYIDEVRPYVDSANRVLLEVRCVKCNNWFIPTATAVQHRARALAGKIVGEARLYCSDDCKSACSIYGRKNYPKGFKHATSREVQPELRQMVLERDDWTCQYGDCGETVEDAELHCHHMEGIKQNPIESADIDMCITLCKKHHKQVHKEKGCRYIDMRCK